MKTKFEDLDLEVQKSVILFCENADKQIEKFICDLKQPNAESVIILNEMLIMITNTIKDIAWLNVKELTKEEKKAFKAAAEDDGEEF